MSRLRRVAAAAVVLPLLLGACTTGTDAGARDDRADDGLFEVDVEVDTPQLRAAKQRAGVEPCEPGQAPAPAPADEGLPEVTLACLGGGPDVDLASLTGPMVINLWAQWCGPCREELPYYQQLHERAGDRVQVLGIDYQDPLPDRALALVEEAGVTYPLLADPAGEVRVPFRVRGLPGVVFVDAQGAVTHLAYVKITSFEQLRDLVGKHLDVTL